MAKASKRGREAALLVGPTTPTRAGRVMAPSAAVTWSYPHYGEFASFNGFHAYVLRECDGHSLSGKAGNVYRRAVGNVSDLLVVGAYTSKARLDSKLQAAYYEYLKVAIPGIVERSDFVQHFDEGRQHMLFHHNVDGDIFTAPVPMWMLLAANRFYREATAELEAL